MKKVSITVFNFSVMVAVNAQANLANDELTKLPRSQQASMLGKVVGEGCTGKKAFYMGALQDESFWSLKCTNGENYLISIEGDQMGSSKVMNCATYEAITGLRCFQKTHKIEWRI